MNINEESQGFLLFFLLLSLILRFSFQLQIPFTLYNPSSQNKVLRSLSPETFNNFNYPIILLQLYIGSPISTYNLIYETNSPYSILIANSSGLSHAKNPYDLHNSTTKEITDRQSKLYINGNSYGDGVFVKDEIKTSLSLRGVSFTFMLAIEFYHPFINYNADGIASFSFQYTELTYSLIDTLYISRSIDKKIFAHKFINETHGTLYLGEDGISDEEMRKKEKYCNIDSESWSCTLESLYLDLSGINLESHIHQTAIFSTGDYRIELPYPSVEKLFLDYKKMMNDYDSNNKCYISNLKEHLTLLSCDSINFHSDLPHVTFKFLKNLTLTLPGCESFMYSNDNKRYEFVILGDTSGLSKGKIGLSLLKNYHMIFDKGQYHLGFIPLNIFYKASQKKYSGWLLSFFFIFLLALLIFLIWYLFRMTRRQSKKYNKITIEQIQEITSIFIG